MRAYWLLLIILNALADPALAQSLIAGKQCDWNRVLDSGLLYHKRPKHSGEIDICQAVVCSSCHERPKDGTRYRIQ